MTEHTYTINKTADGMYTLMMDGETVAVGTFGEMIGVMEEKMKEGKV